jgi:hypothetical protein
MTARGPEPLSAALGLAEDVGALAQEAAPGVADVRRVLGETVAERATARGRRRERLAKGEQGPGPGPELREATGDTVRHADPERASAPVGDSAAAGKGPKRRVQGRGHTEVSPSWPMGPLGSALAGEGTSQGWRQRSGVPDTPPARRTWLQGPTGLALPLHVRVHQPQRWLVIEARTAHRGTR